MLQPNHSISRQQQQNSDQITSACRPRTTKEIAEKDSLCLQPRRYGSCECQCVVWQQQQTEQRVLTPSSTLSFLPQALQAPHVEEDGEWQAPSTNMSSALSWMTACCLAAGLCCGWTAKASQSEWRGVWWWMCSLCPSGRPQLNSGRSSHSRAAALCEVPHVAVVETSFACSAVLLSHRFSTVHNFEKPNDKRALDLMDECAKVCNRLDVVLAL